MKKTVKKAGDISMKESILNRRNQYDFTGVFSPYEPRLAWGKSKLCKINLYVKPKAVTTELVTKWAQCFEL